MQRVVILGRGGAGKSTLARHLGAVTGLPVLELDQHFWQEGLLPLSPDAWLEMQRHLAGPPAWVMDGDLGPHDVLEARLAHADTVIVLDYPLPVCAWRAVRRSREGRDFWLWVWHYRRRHLHSVLRAVQDHAPSAAVHRLRSPQATRQFLQDLPMTMANGVSVAPVRTSSRIAFAISWLVFAVAVVLAWRKVLAVPDGRGDVTGLFIATVCGTAGLVLLMVWLQEHERR